MTLDQRPAVRRVLIITLLLNLFVMGLKAFLGWKTGSLSLLADALHSVTDSANNILGLLTSRLASPYPDRDHPYGHQKFDAVGALAIAAFLGIACFEILQSAIGRLLRPGRPVRLDGPELWLLLVVLGVNIFVAFYERREGIRVGSQILIADAKHTMSDIWVTILVLLRAGERPVTELAQELRMTQPGASKHLRVLREVGLVRGRKAGKQG